jgi:D-alanine-D-alanine ligase
MEKIRVGVLRGGPSAEHEVSLKTGENVLRYLPDKYLGIDLFLDKNGQWHFGPARNASHSDAGGGSSINPYQLKDLVDVVCLALHGKFGEDGEVQNLLETFKIPYTGSGVLASAVAMNKFLSREFFKKSGFKISQAIVVKNDEPISEVAHRIFRRIPPFWVVKPVSGGSSIGVSIVRDFNDLVPALMHAFKYDDEVLVEEHINGKEVTCGILENFRGEEHYALPIVEIVPPPAKDFFDYECKYDGSSQEICPAHLDISLKKEIENVARLAHEVLGCEGYSRADMIVSDKGIYLLEVNTLPGLTSESLIPKAARTVGLEFPHLLDHIIGLALNKRR